MTHLRRLGEIGTAAATIYFGWTSELFAHEGHAEASAGPVHTHGGLEVLSVLLVVAIGLLAWRSFDSTDA